MLLIRKTTTDEHGSEIVPLKLATVWIGATFSGSDGVFAANLSQDAEDRVHTSTFPPALNSNIASFPFP